MMEQCVNDKQPVGFI